MHGAWRACAAGSSLIRPPARIFRLQIFTQRSSIRRTSSIESHGMYSTAPPLFVAVDLASVTTLEPAGLRRCLDTVFTAADARDGLRSVFGMLERVLVAHVTCDPFVAERRGTRDL